jgi:hypothetical protein
LTAPRNLLYLTVVDFARNVRTFLASKDKEGFGHRSDDIYLVEAKIDGF